MSILRGSEISQEPKPAIAGAAPRWLSWPAALLATLLLAFVAQGTRGIWEPDEGFYANVAVEMVQSGDWWLPKLNGSPFLDKPPLQYWGMALGAVVFGVDEWSLRCAHALWLVGTAILVGLFAQELWGRRAGPAGALAYSMTLAPFLAANVLTPDTPLTFAVSAMAFSYWKWQGESSPGREILWSGALGLAGGLGLLAKGPAVLVFAFPLALHLLLTRGVAGFRRPLLWVACAGALAVGGSWYALIALKVPGAWSYFFDNQVAGRLWSDHYQRNAGWSGPFKVYLPMLLAGGLPWSLALPRWFRSSLRDLRGSGELSTGERSTKLLLMLWIVAPLAVLALASSRLPLYALPILPAIALAAVGLHLSSEGKGTGSRSRRLLPGFLSAWCFVLIGLKVGAAFWPTADDSRSLARSLRDLGIERSASILAVDCKRNGLPVYGYDALQTVRHRSRKYPFFTPQPMLLDALQNPAAANPSQVLLVRQGRSPELLEDLQAEDFQCRLLGSIVGTEIVRCLPHLPDRQAAAGQPGF
ncbi:MAG: glycosyltransferase family 39 protein [Acidobacteria bacterium]|nr:glycosyltransferase family 39 protein [Acidobacteriota bacterium]